MERKWRRQGEVTTCLPCQMDLSRAVIVRRFNPRFDRGAPPLAASDNHPRFCELSHTLGQESLITFPPWGNQSGIVSGVLAYSLVHPSNLLIENNGVN